MYDDKGKLTCVSMDDKGILTCVSMDDKGILTCVSMDDKGILICVSMDDKGILTCVSGLDDEPGMTGLDDADDGGVLDDLERGPHSILPNPTIITVITEIKKMLFFPRWRCASEEYHLIYGERGYMLYSWNLFFIWDEYLAICTV